MELDPEKLSAFLDLLLDHQVEEFEGNGIHVRFSQFAAHSEPAVELADPDRATRVERSATGVWDNPTLWPAGRRPTFPGKDTK